MNPKACEGGGLFAHVGHYPLYVVVVDKKMEAYIWDLGFEVCDLPNNDELHGKELETEMASGSRYEVARCAGSRCLRL